MTTDISALKGVWVELPAVFDPKSVQPGRQMAIEAYSLAPAPLNLALMSHLKTWFTRTAPDISGFYVLANTEEAYSLSFEEKKKLFTEFRTWSDSQRALETLVRPWVAGIHATSIQESLELMSLAKAGLATAVIWQPSDDLWRNTGSGLPVARAIKVFGESPGSLPIIIVDNLRSQTDCDVEDLAKMYQDSPNLVGFHVINTGILDERLVKYKRSFQEIKATISTNTFSRSGLLKSDSRVNIVSSKSCFPEVVCQHVLGKAVPTAFSEFFKTEELISSARSRFLLGHISNLAVATMRFPLETFSNRDRGVQKLIEQVPTIELRNKVTE